MSSAADYHQRAQQHRPTDPAAIAAEVMRLHREGLRPRDIASALQMNDVNVIQIIGRGIL